MLHRWKGAGLRPRTLALALALLLAAGQVAGCASSDPAGETMNRKPLGPQTGLWVAGAALLSVIAAGVAADSAGD